MELDLKRNRYHEKLRITFYPANVNGERRAIDEELAPHLAFSKKTGGFEIELMDRHGLERDVIRVPYALAELISKTLDILRRDPLVEAQSELSGDTQESLSEFISNGLRRPRS